MKNNKKCVSIITVSPWRLGTDTIPRQYTSEGGQCQMYGIDI